ncbi:MAG TPA: hypothetical protein VFF06_14490 [Polyangia bacterium]|nr:hypothetical protein [Polyangia bacterium]
MRNVLLVAALVASASARVRAQAPPPAAPLSAPTAGAPPTHFEHRIQTGLVIGGALTLSVTWALTGLLTWYFSGLYCGLSESHRGVGCDNHAWMYVPIAGPWVELRASSSPNTAGAVSSGLLQAGGLVLLIAGLVGHRVQVWDRRVQLQPYFASGGGGVTLALRF